MKPDRAASAACRPRRGGLADREPARGGHRGVMAGAGRRHDQRGGQRMRGLRLIEPQQPGGDGGDAERGGEIARPDAAIEHARPVDGGAEPDHGLVARDDGGGEIGRVDLRQRRPRWSAPPGRRWRRA